MLPLSEIDRGLLSAVFTGSKEKYNFTELAQRVEYGNYYYYYLRAVAAAAACGGRISSGGGLAQE